jgi:hypothetical protein
MDKESADWYLARSISTVIHSNPDLQTRALLERFPKKFNTPMDEMIWLPTVRWLTMHETPVPEVRGGVPEGPADLADVRERAIDLYLRALTDEKADRRLRQAAGPLAADTNVNSHPRIRPVLKKLRPGYAEDDAAEVAAMPEAWRRNFEYFKRWVAPELTKRNREDEFACLGCHAVEGRVPSMQLMAADNNGYQSASTLHFNYKTLLERVDENNVEQSKVLRKPLNVQSGQEDGHQGGRRYNPGDRAYEILRRWVLDAAVLKKSGGSSR